MAEDWFEGWAAGCCAAAGLTLSLVGCWIAAACAALMCFSAAADG